MSERTVKDALAGLDEKGLASQPRHGYWQAVESNIVVEVDEASEELAKPKAESAIAYKAQHNCTIESPNSGNGHHGFSESAEVQTLM
jgi:hypothetical protein